jgi:MFS family permease
MSRLAFRMTVLRKGMNRNIALLALTSLCADISTEMIYPVLPFYLTSVLLAPASVLGLIEGIAEGIQYGVQGPAGSLADWMRRKKPLGAVGYALAAIGKPIIGLALVWPVALLGRALDRLGAGIRSAPRDALIAASAARGHRALAFGLEGVGDNVGAFVGPLVTLLLVSLLQTSLRGVFLLVFIPGALALLLFLLVREGHRDGDRSAGQEGVEKGVETSTAEPIARRLTLRSTAPAYWRYLVVTGLFGIGNSTNAFLLLRLQGIGAAFTTTLLVYAFFNLVAALVSAPAGALADHLRGPKWVLFGCFLVFAVVYLGFALGANSLLLALLFVGYGVYQGAYRTLGKAYAADLVHPAMRASGLGWYGTVFGLSSLIASLVGGWLWTNIAPAATFLYGAAGALVASLALAILMPNRGSTDTPEAVEPSPSV